MESNLTQIIGLLHEAIQDNLKTISDLTKQVENLHIQIEGSKTFIQGSMDRIDTLESDISDLENLDYQVNNNESNIECLESRFMEFKETSEKELNNLEAHIEENYPLNPIDATIEKVNLLLSNYLNGRPTP